MSCGCYRHMRNTEVSFGDVLLQEEGIAVVFISRICRPGRKTVACWITSMGKPDDVRIPTYMPTTSVSIYLPVCLSFCLSVWLAGCGDGDGNGVRGPDRRLGTLLILSTHTTTAAITYCRSGWRRPVQKPNKERTEPSPTIYVCRFVVPMTCFMQR